MGVYIRLHMAFIVIYTYMGGMGLSIPAYFIPAHFDGAWSKILGCVVVVFPQKIHYFPEISSICMKY